MLQDKKKKMLDATEQGNMATVVRLIAIDATLINCEGEDGKMPLLNASIKGHLETVTFLASNGSLIDQPGNYGQTPLHYASRDKHRRICNYGYTAFLMASKHGHLEIVRDWWMLAPDWYMLTKYDGNTAKDLATDEGHSAVALNMDETVAQLRLSVPSALIANEMDEGLATLSRIIPPTGGQNAADLVYRAVAYLCVGKKECAWKDARASIELGETSVYYSMGDNFVLFNDQFKLIDFECTELIGEDVEAPHFTREYCPPEMERFYFNQKLNSEATPMKASTALDVWSAAVLVLQLFSRRGYLIEFENLEKEDEIPESIASSIFSFRESIDDAVFSQEKRKILEMCLCIDPAGRGTLEDILRLIPQLTKRSYDSRTAMDNTTYW
ncbi:Aste57867_16466 [Aphanomyces stellatus]|uniref:Aste57867_16466 protein n=1 Tax=Aphanomyces stellatus TaxID=120398 RepID=A0A485L6H8_9STRA|nr:hypothetical protein As57867_016409 [Aphanomyces stellatus]VFT93240.1 Aste57867_16466 [Aphanomyces stellatus]